MSCVFHVPVQPQFPSVHGVQQCLVVSGLHGFCVVWARPNLKAQSVQGCVAGRDCQGKPMLPAAPCSPSCCLPAKFSSSSAHLSFYLFCWPLYKETASVFCSERTLAKSWQVFTDSWSSLGANRVLNSLGHPLCLWVTGSKVIFLWMCEF